ncbi:hypothetical protein Tco_1166018 [Tanacetum coccineum]
MNTSKDHTSSLDRALIKYAEGENYQWGSTVTSPSSWKKIILLSDWRRRDLQLEDAEGVDCLPNATIFEQLTLMSAKNTAWSEFSSTMASAIICLATSQKFNFSKYIFESMVRNLENVSGKFLMYLLALLFCKAGVLHSKLSSYEVRLLKTRFENVSKHCNDSLLARGNTLRSGEDSLKLNELMEICTNLQTRVLDLERTKTTQAEETVSLKRRVKKLEHKRDDVDMFDVNTLTGDEVLVEQEVATKDVNLTIDEVTLAQALAALKIVKSKVKGDVIEEPSVPVSAASTKVSAATTTTTATIPTPRKGIVITELEKRYPLTPTTITDMLNKKLQCDHFSEMDNQLLKLLTKQLKNLHEVMFGSTPVITEEYLVNISKRRAFWSLNEDILKITILTTNTPYPSRKIRQQILLIYLPLLQDILIRASRLKKVMADKGKKSSMETFAPNDKADYYSRIISIIVNKKNPYEMKGKFLDDLQNNAFSGTNGKDAVEHIEDLVKEILMNISGEFTKSGDLEVLES